MPVVDLDATQRQTLFSVDEALTSCKEFGWGQQLQLLLVGMAWVLAALQTLAAAVFGTLDPVRHGQAVCAQPEDEACTAALAEGHLCSLPRNAWQWRASGFSLATDFDLVCGRRWLLYFQTSAFFVAVLAGCVLWQMSAERYGRRRLLYSGAGLCGVASLMAATAPSLWAHLAFRCAAGVGVGGMGVAAFALATDVAGPSWRGFAGMAMNHFFSVGACLGTLLAWWIPNWRWLAAVCGLCCLAYSATWSLVTESPQWLLLRGKKGEATAALAAIAFANGTRPPEHPLADPTALLGNTQRGLRDMLASSWLRQRLVLLAAAWFAAGTAYFGLMLLADGLSSTSGDGSIVALLLTGFAYEVPGIAAAGLAAERAGRKATGIAAFLQAGVCLVVSAVAGGTAQRALVVAARFGLAAAFAALYLYTGELFPAVVQEHGLGAANAVSRAGTAITPLWAFLQYRLRSSFVPLLVLGCLCLAAAALALGLPETLGEKQPETIAELNVLQAMRRKRSWRLALAGMLRPVASQASMQPGRTASSAQDELYVAAAQRSV